MTTAPHRAVSVTMALLLVSSLSPATTAAAPAPIRGSGATASPTSEVVELEPADGSGDAIGPGWQAIVEGLEATSVLVSFVDGPEQDAALRIRSRAAGRWSAWVEVHTSPDEAPDAGTEGRPAAHPVVGPVWTGPGTDAIEVEVVEGSAGALRVHAVDTSSPAEPPVVLAAAAGGPIIRSTAAWGSPGWSWSTDGCGGGPTTAPFQAAIVHHTASTNAYTTSEVDDVLRSIYHGHLARGWCDVAYNFFVDRFGQIWQGRSGPANGAVVGGHAAGFNTGTVGIALLGQHHSSGQPPATAPTSAQLDAVARIIGWKMSLHDLDPMTSTTYEVRSTNVRFTEGDRVTIPRVTSHRDVGSTSCPGDLVYARLGDIRTRAAALRSQPSTFAYGVATDRVLWGDWDGDGAAEPAVRRNNTYYLRMTQTGGAADVAVTIGWGTDQAIVGDWDGDGIDTIGLYRDGNVYLTSANVPRPAVTHSFRYGTAGDLALAGDFDGDGRDGIGIRRGNVWHLRQTASGGLPSISFGFGWGSDTALMGDWDGDGIDTAGVWRDGTVYTAASLGSSPHAAAQPVAVPGSRVIAGDPTGRGFDMVGGVVGQHWQPWVPMPKVAS